MFQKSNTITLTEGCITGEAIYRSLLSGKRDQELQQIIDIINKNNYEYTIDTVKEILFGEETTEETRKIKLEILKNIFLEMYFPEKKKNKIKKISKSTVIDFFNICKKHDNKSEKLLWNTQENTRKILKNYDNKKGNIPIESLSSIYELPYAFKYYHETNQLSKIEEIVTKKSYHSSWPICQYINYLKNIEEKKAFLEIPGVVSQVSEKHRKSIIKKSNNHKDIVACFDMPHKTVSGVRHILHSMGINI